MKRFAIIAALAIITPVRRGVMRAEGALVSAERRLRWQTGALFIALSFSLVACAPWQTRRELRRIETRYERAYAAATTREEVVEIHARCEAAIEGVRNGR